MLKYGATCKYCSSPFKYDRVFCYINDGKIVQTNMTKLCSDCIKKQKNLELEWLGCKKGAGMHGCRYT